MARRDANRTEVTLMSFSFQWWCEAYCRKNEVAAVTVATNAASVGLDAEKTA